MKIRPRIQTTGFLAYAALLLVALIAIGGCSKESESGDSAEAGATSEEAMNDKQTRSAGQNRLALEKSPYLLQHKDNPVDWYPWGDEAFEAAAAQDKPIFLSIGYSTCHWCHVMEHESFEDSTVAAMMNDAFINIKVDREERPDIDQIYMTVCQMMTQRGGWPLTIVMTPERKPFFAGTYFPKNKRFQSPGMLELIPQLERAWRDKRAEVLAYADGVTDEMQKHQQPHDHDHAELTEQSLEKAAVQLTGVYDARNGGFGNAPKFPTPHQLMFMLRWWKRSGDDEALRMVEHTLDAMAAGGIYDHLGYGFHRYSVDARWFAPHFEKMLYDQALLVMAYTEGYVATGKAKYRRIAEETIEYVLRDMTDSRGGFYSAEDADSEGIEGKFYLWSVAEIRELLGEDADIFINAYSANPKGNFSEEIEGGNILFLFRPLDVVAQDVGMSEDALREQLARSRKILFEARKKRIHPGKDDKVLTDWNGLMIAALAQAGSAFGEPEYITAAERAANFVTTTLRRDDGSLVHRYRDGDAALQGNIDDYAFMIWGLTDLYQATFDISYLQTALELNDYVLEKFWDHDAGGVYFTPEDGEELIVRMKEQFDGASPSGNAVMMLNLIRLARLTANPLLEDYAAQAGASAADLAEKSAAGVTMLLCGLDFGIGPSFEVVIVGKSGREDTRAMQQAVREVFLPNKVVVFKDEDNPEISDLAVYTATQTGIDNKATAYVCRNYACELPTTEVKTMVDLLTNPSD